MLKIYEIIQFKSENLRKFTCGKIQMHNKRMWGKTCFDQGLQAKNMNLFYSFEWCTKGRDIY